ncbi:MAG: hypothetical protein RSJ41_00695 [Clostridia bacterium]
MKQGLKLGGRALAIYLMDAVLSLLVLGGIGDDWRWMQLVLNGLMLAGMAVVMFESGAYRGERAATLSATVERMQEENHVPDEATRAGCFSKKVAGICALTVLLPLLAVASINLIAQPLYPPVMAEENAPTPEELGAMLAGMNEGERAQYEMELREQVAKTNYVSVATRLVFMPMVGVYGFFGRNPTGLNWLFVLFSALVALPAALGYLLGPQYRAKKLEQMRKSNRRKLRKAKVSAQRRPPKPEV